MKNDSPQLQELTRRAPQGKGWVRPPTEDKPSSGDVFNGIAFMVTSSMFAYVFWKGGLASFHQCPIRASWCLLIAVRYSLLFVGITAGIPLLFFPTAQRQIEAFGSRHQTCTRWATYAFWCGYFHWFVTGIVISTMPPFQL